MTRRPVGTPRSRRCRHRSMKRSGDRNRSIASSAWSTAAGNVKWICSTASAVSGVQEHSAMTSLSTTTARHAPLAMSADTFSAIGHQLVDQIAALLASVPDRTVTKDHAPSAIRTALDLNGPLPHDGEDASTLLTNTTRQLFDHSLFNAHPRFFGYITASPAPIGILADFLASALNPNIGSWVLAPAATEIEAQTVRWIAELIAFPAGGNGVLVSGGNMANVVCLLAARAAVAPWDVRTEGMRGSAGRELIAYASRETHTWLQKATDICGLGTNAIRWIETNDAQQLDVGALRRA